MREAMGGAYLYALVIVFIFFFMGFVAYSISYTRAFNVKNGIISILEEYEGYGGEAEKRINDFIDNAGYNKDSLQNIDCEATTEGSKNAIKSQEGGFCLVKYCSKPDDKKSNVRYKVTTYIVFELGITKIRIPIKGETRTIYTDYSNHPCSDQ